MNAAANPLADWLKNRNQADFARSVGISPAHLSLVCKNKRGLSQKRALLIEEKTAGAVTVSAMAKLGVTR